MKAKHRLTYCIIIPCHNEAGIIHKTVTKLADFCKITYGKDWQIIVADNGSTNNTTKESLPTNEQIRYFHYKQAGRGATLKKVIKAVEAEYYIYVDADLPVPLSTIKKQFALLHSNKTDIAIIKREGDRPFIRNVFTRLLAYTNYFLLGLRYSDAQAGLQAINYKASRLLIKLPDDGFYLHSQIIAYGIRNNLRIKETPSQWIDRRYDNRQSTVKLISNSSSMFVSALITSLNISALSKLLPKLLLIFLSVGVYLTIFGNHDPDFGWHLRAGKWIVENNQIPTTDFLSFTMNGQEWINFEWLQDIIFWITVNSGNKWLLVLIFAILTLIPWWFWLNKERSLFFYNFIAIAALSTYYIIGIRPQTVSFVLFFLLLRILFSSFWEGKSTLSKLFTIGILFLIWTNLHAGFFGGLIILAITCFVPSKWSSNLYVWKTHWQKNWTYIVVAILATLINPFGWHIYQEIFTASLSPLTNKYINEWLPIFTLDRSSILLMSALTGTVLAFIAKYWRSLKAPLVIGMLFFLVQAILSMRMTNLFALLGIECVYAGLVALRKTKFNLKTVSEMRWLGILSMTILIVMTANLTIYTMGKNSPPPIAGMNSLAYLNSYDEVRVFNQYRWGGAMTVYIPEIKVFIDGRMPHWVNKEQGINAMQDYVEVTRDPEDISETEYNWQEVFEKWEINTVFLDTKTKLTEELIDNGWHVYYEDKQSIIVTKIGA